MKKLFVLFIFSIAATLLHAQVPTIQPGAPNDTNIYRFTEVMPKFPGGDSAFTKFLTDSLRYPKAEKKHKVQGTVYISFVIEKDGSISHLVVERGVENGPGLSEEAIRVFSSMPKWEPGTINGKPVRTKIVQPVRFMLN